MKKLLLILSLLLPMLMWGQDSFTKEIQTNLSKKQFFTTMQLWGLSNLADYKSSSVADSYELGIIAFKADTIGGSGTAYNRGAINVKLEATIILRYNEDGKVSITAPSNVNTITFNIGDADLQYAGSNTIETVSEYLETIKKINKNYYNEGAVLCYPLDNKFRNIVEDLIPHIDSSKSKLSNGEKRQKEIADFMTKTIVDNDKWVSGLMEKMIYSLKNSH